MKRDLFRYKLDKQPELLLSSMGKGDLGFIYGLMCTYLQLRLFGVVQTITDMHTGMVSDRSAVCSLYTSWMLIMKL